MCFICDQPYEILHFWIKVIRVYNVDPLSKSSFGYDSRSLDLVLRDVYAIFQYFLSAEKFQTSLRWNTSYIIPLISLNISRHFSDISRSYYSFCLDPTFPHSVIICVEFSLQFIEELENNFCIRSFWSIKLNLKAEPWWNRTEFNLIFQYEKKHVQLNTLFELLR